MWLSPTKALNLTIQQKQKTQSNDWVFYFYDNIKDS